MGKRIRAWVSANAAEIVIILLVIGTLAVTLLFAELYVTLQCSMCKREPL